MENENKEIVNAEIVETQETESTIEIKNTSTFSKEGYKQMNKELAKKNYSLIVAMEIILVAMDVWFYVNYKTMLTYGIVVSCFIVSYPFLITWMAKRQLEKTFKIYNNVFDSAKYEFTFYEKALKIDLTANGSTSNSVMNYSKLYSIIENNDYIFVFISSNQAYIVEKKGFTNPEDVQTLMDLFKKNGLKCKRAKTKKN